MKFVRFDHGATGLLVERGAGLEIIDIAKSAVAYEARDRAGGALIRELLGEDGASDWTVMIERWADVRPILEKLLAFVAEGGTGTTIAVRETRLLPPLARSAPSIFAIGGNISAHVAAGSRHANIPVADLAQEKAEGHPPWGFVVLPATIAGPDGEVGPPRGTRHFDYEAEVAVILKGHARHVTAGEVNIWGYTAWNDLSIRDPRLGLGPVMNRGSFSFALEKNFDRSHVCGPCVVVDEHDVGNLRVSLTVNGEVRQDFSTSDLVWSFSETAAHLSQYVSLQAGDMIASGTGAGVAMERGAAGDRWLRPGDLIELSVEGVGTLRSRVGTDW